MSEFDINRWAIDYQINSGEAGSCSDWKDTDKIKYGVRGAEHPGRKETWPAGRYIEDGWFTGGASTPDDYQGRPTNKENRRM